MVFDIVQIKHLIWTLKKGDKNRRGVFRDNMKDMEGSVLGCTSGVTMKFRAEKRTRVYSQQFERERNTRLGEYQSTLNKEESFVLNDFRE